MATVEIDAAQWAMISRCLEKSIISLTFSCRRLRASFESAIIACHSRILMRDALGDR